MLIIRKAQMDALNLPFVAEFREHVTEYLYAYYAEKCKEMGPQGIDALIDQGIAKANRYGIEMEEEILDLIEIMFENGANFENTPDMAWAAEVLNDSSATGSQRISRLVAGLEVARNTPLKQ